MDVEVNKTAHGFMVPTRAPLGKRSLGDLPCGGRGAHQGGGARIVLLRLLN
jgi:hypothetical protein